MTQRSNAIGPDVLNPGRVPTPERQAELDAGLEEPMMAVDLNTLEGVKNGVRPAAAILLFGTLLGFIVALISIMAINANPELEIVWPVFLGMFGMDVALVTLAWFMFQRSLTAMILALVYCGYLWVTKVLDIIEYGFAGILGGMIFLLLFTPAGGLGLSAAYKFDQYKKGELDLDTGTDSEPENEPDSEPGSEPRPPEA